METEAIKQNIILRDERLDIDQLDQYLLSFFIGSGSCELAVFDERKKRLLMLESYRFDPAKTLLENLKTLHYDHVLISAGFWKRVEVVLRNARFCQVPNALYSGEHAYDYLKLNAPVDPLNEKYRSVLDENQGVTTVFSVPNELISWFNGKYPKPLISFKHESTVNIQAMGAQLGKSDEAQLFINLTATDLQLAGYADGRLHIYNQFALQEPEKAAKLILMSLQQFSKAGQATPITLWGIERSVNDYAPLLRKYYKHLRMGEKPKGLKMSHIFDGLAPYEYFDVMSSFL